jgi:hypothetical protein
MTGLACWRPESSSSFEFNSVSLAPSIVHSVPTLQLAMTAQRPGRLTRSTTCLLWFAASNPARGGDCSRRRLIDKPCWKEPRGMKAYACGIWVGLPLPETMSRPEERVARRGCGGGDVVGAQEVTATGAQDEDDEATDIDDDDDDEGSKRLIVLGHGQGRLQRAGQRDHPAAARGVRRQSARATLVHGRGQAFLSCATT